MCVCVCLNLYFVFTCVNYSARICPLSTIFMKISVIFQILIRIFVGAQWLSGRVVKCSWFKLQLSTA